VLHLYIGIPKTHTFWLYTERIKQSTAHLAKVVSRIRVKEVVVRHREHEKRSVLEDPRTVPFTEEAKNEEERQDHCRKIQKDQH